MNAPSQRFLPHPSPSLPPCFQGTPWSELCRQGSHGSHHGSEVEAHSHRPGSPAATALRAASGPNVVVSLSGSFVVQRQRSPQGSARSSASCPSSKRPPPRPRPAPLPRSSELTCGSVRPGRRRPTRTPSQSHFLAALPKKQVGGRPLPCYLAQDKFYQLNW